MAKPLLTALSLMFEEQLAEVPYRPYTLLNVLTKRYSMQSKIKWNANVGGATTGGRAITADASGTASGFDVAKPAELPIGGWVVNHIFHVLLTEVQQAQAHSNAIAALKDIFGNHLRTAVDVILPTLNKVCYTGTGASDATHHGVFGLAAVTNNGAAYAGIDPSTDAGWVANVLTNASDRVLTRDLMSAVEIAIQRNGAPYDVIITTPELMQVYGKLFALDRNLTVNQVNGVADLNFSGYNWGGTPILTDVDCPNKSMYFLNSQQCQFYTYDLSGANPEIAVTKNLQSTNGLQYMISQLPSNNPHSVKFEVSVIPQMKVHNRKFVTVINSLDQALAAYS